MLNHLGDHLHEKAKLRSHLKRFEQLNEPEHDLLMLAGIVESMVYLTDNTFVGHARERFQRTFKGLDLFLVPHQPALPQQRNSFLRVHHALSP